MTFVLHIVEIWGFDGSHPIASFPPKLPFRVVDIA